MHSRGYERLKSADELARLADVFQSIATGMKVDNSDCGIRGSASEHNVFTALSRMSLVSHVDRTVKNSEEDAAGIDLVVFLNPSVDSYSNLTVVNAQVKSSNKGIAEFKDRLGRKLGLYRPDAVDLWLAEQQLVLLNGKDPRHVIQQNFLTQLTPIKTAAR